MTAENQPGMSRPDLPLITEQPSAFCDVLRHRRVAFTTRPGKCGTHVDPGGCKGRSFIKVPLILLSASKGGVACVHTCGMRLHASFAEPRSAWEHVRTSDSWSWSPTVPQTHWVDRSPSSHPNACWVTILQEYGMANHSVLFNHC